MMTDAERVSIKARYEALMGRSLLSGEDAMYQVAMEEVWRVREPHVRARYEELVRGGTCGHDAALQVIAEEVARARR